MRFIDVGGNQGRGNPPAVQDDDQRPSMLVNRWLWLFFALCVAIWSGLWFAAVNWLHQF